MSSINEFLSARDEYIARVKAELLGPGSEISIPDAEHELITNSPDVRYSIGILFPKNNKLNADNNDPSRVEESSEPSEDLSDEEEETADDEKEKTDPVTPAEEENLDEEISLAAQNMPSSLGLTFLASSNPQVLKCEVAFATYRKAKMSDCRIPFYPDSPEKYSVPTQLSSYVVYDSEEKCLKLCTGLNRKTVHDLYERDFLDGEEYGIFPAMYMSGIFIYTASGDSEGTMGGLVRQGYADTFPGIFKKAMEESMTCSNDPVCSLSMGQGRDSLNLSACYSCCLIPETSCEEFNIFLDRGTIVGTYENREMGFYSKQLHGAAPWKENSVPEDNNEANLRSRTHVIITDQGTDLRDSAYELYQGLKRLYALYEDMGEIPYGSATYTRVDSSFRQFLSIIQNDPSAARMIGNEENYDLVKTLLRLITQTSSLESLKRSLTELQDENLQHLTTSLNIEKLQRVAKLMEDNLENDSEEFWQTTVFKEHQWVLAQIFACPCTIFADKAYVGGKGINNSGGNLCDFIYQNSLSQNVALIEIKTPCTELIGNQYRGTYSFSYELSGAINQVLNYRDKLTKEYYSLCHQSSEPFEVLSPKCVVIIGKMASLTPGQVAAFENFRNSLSNVLILTFDELYQRIVDLIAVLSESPNQQPRIFEPETGNEDLPF